MKIYISLPISADPIKAREKADNIMKALSKQGHKPVNPFDIYAGKKPTYEDYICYDLRAMLDCDAIYFCKGWHGSLGCNIEYDVAINYKKFGRKDFKRIYEE